MLEQWCLTSIHSGMEKGVITKGVFPLEACLESLNSLELPANGRRLLCLLSTLWWLSRVTTFSLAICHAAFAVEVTFLAGCLFEIPTTEEIWAGLCRRWVHDFMTQHMLSSKHMKIAHPQIRHIMTLLTVSSLNS